MDFKAVPRGDTSSSSGRRGCSETERKRFALPADITARFMHHKTSFPDQQIAGWLEGRKEGRKDGWMDGWIYFPK
ncbi:Uncharacterized protein BM_BM9889 [Brugia malayi]|uniref:Bm9889 n=1 Tax=Brugia malayi TaxID=6279 RepID=A0A1P6CHT0_BRUMA|nr:Uncharacterized protein BM_BM9889 [Brugia malayi]CDP95819.1 Bm9889 [Brugia malayi]VIO99666.1 Uncharacterized protein BM_BM9889 [Brugia malayi]